VSAERTWLLVALLAAATIAVKAFGPIAMGGRSLPPHLAGVIALLPAALLAALVVTHTFTDDHNHFRLGADAAGVLAAAGITLRGGSVLRAVVVAAALTGALRALG
jgi:branched-subunit amino acid transport protein